MSVKVYGIKNCNTMKKAFTWLDENGVSYDFHDYKKVGIDDAKIEEWMSQTEPSKLINNRGMTFRKFSDEMKANFGDAAVAKEMMLENQSVIKRPIIEKDGKIVLFGFKDEEYVEVFK
ncbi:Spx/MgsR family RNA polymerase-binding regulatory protein [Jiulongibacter sp. NS-SX5]|uniref:Spx/MgsR family RNA polymerase-binding regulatory protein n=1 Tax=Jiulongibacter sp. NS-SX5 TaxID=3463854 RepID=UPI00405850D0